MPIELETKSNANRIDSHAGNRQTNSGGGPDLTSDLKSSKEYDKLRSVYNRHQSMIQKVIQPDHESNDSIISLRSEGSLLLPDRLKWTRLITGILYYGRWNQFGFDGPGLYRFTDGLIYDGNLKDGHFHGNGKIKFPNGDEIDGTWNMGKNVNMTFKFADGLVFNKEDWEYCQKDHRYV